MQDAMIRLKIGRGAEAHDAENGRHRPLPWRKDGAGQTGALGLLATGRKEVPTTWDLLTQRAREDRDAGVRWAALGLVIAHYELDRQFQIILSRDLDGLPPSSDLEKPISKDRVQRCTLKLGVTADRVMEMFERLGQIFPLRLDVSA